MTREPPYGWDGAECIGPEDIATIRGEIPPVKPLEDEEPGVIKRSGKDPEGDE